MKETPTQILSGSKSTAAPKSSIGKASLITKSPPTLVPNHEVQEGTAAVNIPFNAPGNGGGFPPASSLRDAVLTTVVGLALGDQLEQISSQCSDDSSAVFVGGVAYVKWYKKQVLNKVRPML